MSTETRKHRTPWTREDLKHLRILAACRRANRLTWEGIGGALGRTGEAARRKASKTAGRRF